ncbi:MAG: SGNH/GDSL hydrolase family protein [Paraprevotella sp.]|nr:SGNH/GDSL hydrolase family protein [Paraprevotella sp.]
MKEYLRLILVLLIPLAILLAYSSSGYRLVFNGWNVSKVKRPSGLLSVIGWNRSWNVMATDACIDDFPLLPDNDTMDANSTAGNLVCEEPDTVSLDTASKRILFFGDSMVEGLSMRFSDYAMENGHQLYSVCWYGSSIGAWASASDSIDRMLAWAQPDYVVVSLGGNELRARDLEQRMDDIQKIQGCLDPLPTVWIAPPSWVRNPTITGAIERAVGTKRYFDSTRLTYTRGSDNMHPTFGSSARWMDSIAVWMSSPMTAHPIVMEPPTRTYQRRWNKRFIFPH